MGYDVLEPERGYEVLDGEAGYEVIEAESEPSPSTLQRTGRSLLEAPIRIERGVGEKIGDVASGSARAADLIKSGDVFSGSPTAAPTSMRQKRAAFERAMKDPRYFEALVAAGNDPAKRLRVENTLGAPGQLNRMRAGEEMRANLAGQEATARQERMETNPVYQWGRDQVKFSDKVFAGSPDIDDTFISELAVAAGGTLPDIMAAYVPVIGPTAAATSYGLQAGEQQAQEAVAAGQPEVADIAFVSAAGLGAGSERLIGFAPRFWNMTRASRLAKLPPEKFGAAVSAWLAKSPRKAAIIEGMLREGVQESTEQAGQNVIASDVAGYDPDRPWHQNVAKAGALGATLGGLMGGASSMLAGEQPKAEDEQKQGDREPPSPARERSQQLVAELTAKPAGLQAAPAGVNTDVSQPNPEPKPLEAIEDLTAAVKDLQATLRGETPESERLKPGATQLQNEQLQSAVQRATTEAGAAIGTVTGQNEGKASDATLGEFASEQMPAEVRAAPANGPQAPESGSNADPTQSPQVTGQAETLTKAPKLSQRAGLTDQDGLLFELSQRGKIPIFLPDNFTLANYRRLKAKVQAHTEGGLTPKERAYWRRLQEKFTSRFEDLYGADGMQMLEAYRAARRAGVASELFAPVNSAVELDRQLDAARETQGRDYELPDLWADIQRLSNAHAVDAETGKQGREFERRVLRGERPKNQQGNKDIFDSAALREGDQFRVQQQEFTVTSQATDEQGTPILQVKDGPKFGEQMPADQKRNWFRAFTEDDSPEARQQLQQEFRFSLGEAARPDTPESAAAIQRVETIVGDELYQTGQPMNRFAVVHRPEWKRNGRSVQAAVTPDGRVIINAGAVGMNAEAMVRKVVREEAAHLLLSSPEGQAAVRQFALEHLSEAEEERLFSMGYTGGRALLADEFIAKQARERTGLWRQLVDQVRQWLASKGLVNLTPDEVARAILRSLNRRGAEAQSGQRFSLAEEPAGGEPQPRKPWQELFREVDQASAELMQRIRERGDPRQRPGVTADQARRAVHAATARWRQLKDALVRHPDYVAHLLTRLQEIARTRQQEGLTPDQKLQLDIDFENLQGDLAQVPQRLTDKISQAMIRRGELESRADRARQGIEQKLPSQAAREDARPTGPVLDEFGLAQQLQELPDRIRDVFSGLKRVKTTLQNLAARSENRDVMAYTKDAADNTAQLAGRQAANAVLHELNRAFGARTSAEINRRNPLREWALTFVIEGGNTREGIEEARQKLLESQFRGRTWQKRALHALDYADAHLARLQPVAELYQKLTDAEVAVENEAGISTLHRSGGYVFHTQDLDAEWGNISFGIDPGGPTSPFKHIRDHNTYADSLAAGVTPRTLNAVDLLQRRMTLGRKLVNYRAWLDNLRGVIDPKTELPLVTDTVKRQRQDGSIDEIPPGGYSIAQLGGQRIALLKGYDGLFASLTSPSYWRSGTLKPMLLNLAGTTKHILLVFDSFHLGRLAFWQVMTRRGAPGYHRGLTMLDSTRADLEAMIENEEVPADWGEALLERKADLDALLQNGLNVAGISDNVFSHWVEHLPVTGTFNKWLFQKFQRGAMVEAALIELDRMRRQFPKLPEKVVARRVAKDINVRFGNLGTQGWIKSRTGRDLARLIFLAPQWNESLIRSEAMAVRDLVKAPLESLRQGRPAIGTMGAAVGLAALAMFLAGQILNYLTRGKPTWENEEEGLGAKISGYVPDVIGDGPGFFVNPMSLPLEITHLIEKNAEKTGGDYTESVRRFMEGRLNLLSRAGHTFVTRHSFEEGKLRTGTDVMRAMGKDLLPVPLPASSLYRGGKQALTGEHEEKYPGQFQFQMMQSFGLKTDRVPSPEQRLRALAQDFNRSQGIVPSAEFYHGDYYELETALRLGNNREARQALEELLAKKNRRQIAEHWRDWMRGPFTGQQRREQEFLQTLTAEQRAAYDQARASRQEIAKRALELLRESVQPK